MNSLENYLLFSLIAVFLLVFYRWLRRYLHRNEIQESFPYVFPFDKELLHGMEVVKVELPQKGTVQMDILSNAGEVLRTVPEVVLAAGTHTLSLDCSGLTPGIYSLKLVFSNQVTTRSFRVGGV